MARSTVSLLGKFMEAVGPGSGPGGRSERDHARRSPALARRKRRAALALAAVCFCVGCGPSFKQTGFLADYSNLKFVGGNSDLAWEAVGPLPEKAPDGIYLPPVLVRGDLFGDPELQAEIQEVLRGRLYVWLRNRYGGALQASSTPPRVDNLALVGKSACELELAVTEVRHGSGVARWLVGFFLGATTLQVEGRLRTLPERRVIAQFACRVVFSGDSHMGLNVKALSDRYCFRVSADWAARDISFLPTLLFERWKSAEAEARQKEKERREAE